MRPATERELYRAAKEKGWTLAEAKERVMGVGDFGGKAIIAFRGELPALQPDSTYSRTLQDSTAPRQATLEECRAADKLPKPVDDWSLGMVRITKGSCSHWTFNKDGWCDIDYPHNRLTGSIL